MRLLIITDLADIETVRPGITFRNQPVGCTATIINQMYRGGMRSQVPQRDCRAFMWQQLFRIHYCSVHRPVRPLDEKDCDEAWQRLSDIDLEADGAGNVQCRKQLERQDVQKRSVSRISSSLQSTTSIFGVGQITSMSKEELGSYSAI